MQIPILDGIYTDEEADFRSSYPVNLIPVPKENGISKGYLRPADGIIQSGSGPGIDRGGINWKGAYYRVMGSKLVSIDQAGTVTVLGDVGGTNQVRFDYSFDRLAIASNNKLYYLIGTSLTQVTDPDLGAVIDVVWIDGYFMTTDGISLVVTELNDPAAVDPLKYGSSEADPDPILGLLKIQNEVYAMNRYTIEVFDNIGGDLFPFQRIEGAQIQKGIIGTHAACILVDAVAFLGSGKNEAPGVYLGANSVATKISTREVDQILLGYSEAQLSQSVLETRVDKGHQHLLVHLPDRTLVYDVAGSSAVQQPLWFYLTSAVDGFSTYRARNLVWVFDRWNCADPTSSMLGYLTTELSSHYGDLVRWEFGTTIVYNESRGAIFHELELVCLVGRSAFGLDPTVSSSYSVDGENWSQEKFIRTGKAGDRAKRMVWFQQGHMRNWRIQRFKGTSDARISIARLEATIEPLNV
ncbi:Phage stabilisation protein [Pseudomonas sp. NFPP07]|uniref:packaged DNA stabilization protein n=1 Tax=Pseudomonas sp. NFPP07 TaxID=1566213 RepID=UPI0008F02E6D|nr:packaged DNA stabilization protein [Pseudomonas sp. NFPP07]SFQ82482.1 Phage stabilisation protein [Pseudomonas sp. NFPP07]